MSWISYVSLRKHKRALPESLLFVLCAALAAAQGGGFFEGVVRDRSGLAIAGAEVRIDSEATGVRQKMLTDSNGHFTSPELPAGRYRFTVRCDGFRTVNAFDVEVGEGETHRADFALTLIPQRQEVTVVSDAPDAIDPSANGVSMQRRSITTELPANGRDLHSLYGLMPGAVLTPAAVTGGGQFSVNGQRANTNTFRIDGISGNTGVGTSAVPGAFPGGTLPTMSAIGSTEGLAVQDEIERMEMQSSDFSPEYGERPGAQVIVETRAGTDDWHGDLFGNIRPRVLDSPDWLATRYGVPLTPASLNAFGGSLGGSVVRNRTFFFADLGQTDAHDTAMQMMAVPSLAARKAAKAPDALLLDAFPVPLGPPLAMDEALAAVPLTKNAIVRNGSIRLDQNVGSKLRFFARFADVFSKSTTNQLGSARANLSSQSATTGTSFEQGSWIHDFRFNYSSAHTSSAWSTTDQAAPALASIALPDDPTLFDNLTAVLNGVNAAGYDSIALPQHSIAALSIGGSGQLLLGSGIPARQWQTEARYTVSRDFRAHALKGGIDFLGIVAGTNGGLQAPTTSAVALSVSALIQGDPLGLTVSSGHSVNSHEFIPVGSVFLQDTYKVSQRLTLLYGVRWNLAVRSTSAYSTLLAFGDWNGPGSQQSSSGAVGAINEVASASWPLRYGQLAPRLGLAYRLPREWVIRAGGGLFYDDALGSLLDPLNLSPLNTWQFTPGMKESGGFLSASPPTLELPQVWEWRASLERELNPRSAFSVSYAGASGTRLLREEATLQPNSEILGSLQFASAGQSSFHALQMQLKGDITPRLYALVSYQWSHSIDNGSEEGEIFLTGPGYGMNTDRGSSSFDVRHNLTGSAAWHPNFLRGFLLSSTVSARTGFPFDVTTVDRSIGLGFANSDRPNLVANVPLWTVDSTVPGGRRLNASAFQIPAGANGNLGRNVLAGPGLFEIDASLRRRFRLGEFGNLEINASVFNLTSRANFSNPVGYLGSALFGLPISMQNLMLGSGTPNSGASPMFQPGGSRTVELGLKFGF